MKALVKRNFTCVLEIQNPFIWKKIKFSRENVVQSGYTGLWGAASERVTTNILCCTKKKKSEFQMSVQGPGLGGSVGGAWGCRGAQGGSSREGAPSYSSITAINTSARDSKIILEIRLEKQQGASFNMKMEETEKVRHE